MNDRQQIQQQKSNTSFTDLGPLKDTERRDLNYAVKEYLLIAGYRLTAMTFYEEVLAQLHFLPYVFLLSFCLFLLASNVSFLLRDALLLCISISFGFFLLPLLSDLFGI